MNKKVLNLKVISLDSGTQLREEINNEIVLSYADLMRAGEAFPLITAIFDGTKYYLIDGFHRYHAYEMLGKASVEVEIIDGTRRDAVYASLAVNKTHGLNRSNETKRRAVFAMLDDPEWSQLGDREIARHCGVSHPFVGTLRKPVKAEAPAPKPKKMVNEHYDEQLDDSIEDDAINYLKQENESLTHKLALHSMDASDEDRALAAELIEAQAGEIKQLKIEVESLTVSRNMFQAECVQLKKQIAMNRKAA